MTKSTRPTKLVRVLEETRPSVEAALADAERELAQLNSRRRRLEAQIARARVVIAADTDEALAERAERLTLHAAMKRVLSKSGQPWLTVHELAREINERQLYEKRDGSDVDATQIHARANKYRHLFEKDGSRIGLVSG